MQRSLKRRAVWKRYGSVALAAALAALIFSACSTTQEAPTGHGPASDTKAAEKPASESDGGCVTYPSRPTREQYLDDSRAWAEVQYDLTASGDLPSGVTREQWADHRISGLKQIGILEILDVVPEDGPSQFGEVYCEVAELKASPMVPPNMAAASLQNPAVGLHAGLVTCLARENPTSEQSADRDWARLEESAIRFLCPHLQ